MTACITDTTTIPADQFLIYHAGFKSFHPKKEYSCCKDNPYISSDQPKAHIWWRGFNDARTRSRHPFDFQPRSWPS